MNEAKKKTDYKIEPDVSQLAPEDVMVRRARESDLIGEIDMIAGGAKQLSGEKMFMIRGLDMGRICNKLSQIKAHIAAAERLLGTA